MKTASEQIAQLLTDSDRLAAFGNSPGSDSTTDDVSAAVRKTNAALRLALPADYPLEIMLKISAIPGKVEGESPSALLVRHEKRLWTRSFLCKGGRIPFVPLPGQQLLFEDAVIIRADESYYAMGSGVVVVECELRGPEHECERVLAKLPSSFVERVAKAAPAEAPAPDT